jgi:hypothetical protein
MAKGSERLGQITRKATDIGAAADHRREIGVIRSGTRS